MRRGFYSVASVDLRSELKYGEIGGRIGSIYIQSTISSRATVADPPRRCST
jgi:hypothetical protein